MQPSSPFTITSTSTSPPPPPDENDGLDPWLIALIAVLSFIFVLSVAVAAFFIIRARKRRLEGHYRPSDMEQRPVEYRAHQFGIPLPNPERLI